MPSGDVSYDWSWNLLVSLLKLPCPLMSRIMIDRCSNDGRDDTAYAPTRHIPPELLGAQSAACSVQELAAAVLPVLRHDAQTMEAALLGGRMQTFPLWEPLFYSMASCLVLLDLYSKQTNTFQSASSTWKLARIAVLRAKTGLHRNKQGKRVQTRPD